MSNYVRAMNIACSVHAKQQYGKYPYVRHLAHVALVLAQCGFADDDFLSAAWLHDSIEDAGLTQEEIGIEVGGFVASLVWAVTDGKGKNRAERHAASFRRMVAFPQSIIIRLADRIANVESSIESDRRLLGMYRKEYPEFRAKLYAASLGVDGCRTRIAGMWSYLDDLLVKDQGEQ